MADRTAALTIARPAPLVLVALASACAQRCGGGCEAAEGFALDFRPTRGKTSDAEAIRSKIEDLPNARMVITEDEVVVFITGRDEQAFMDAKEKSASTWARSVSSSTVRPPARSTRRARSRSPRAVRRTPTNPSAEAASGWKGASWATR